MKEKDKNKIQKNVKREVKKQAKKTIKKHRKTIAITLAVIAVVLIIAIVALYVFKPDIFQGIIDIFGDSSQQTETENPNNNNTETDVGLGEHLKPIKIADANDLNQGDLNPVIANGDKTLKMTLVDVGQGDGIIIELPDERVMYIDGGSRKGTIPRDEVYSRMNSVLESTDKFKAGNKTIDYLIVTHADYDHILSLPLLFENYEVMNICFPRIADINITKTWHNVYDLSQNETYTNNNGQVVKSNYIENVGNYMLGGKTWKMNIYSFLPEDYPVVKASSSAVVKNKISPICVLEYANRNIILTGDATTQTEEYILNQPNYFRKVDADVLKVGHHGARESTSMEFLNAIDAEYALISCATTDYGHPHKDVYGILRHIQKERFVLISFFNTI